MTWVKVDDQFPQHPKTLACGPAAAYLYVTGLAYCSRYLTDGFIPFDALSQLHPGAKKKEADMLERVGYWDRGPIGWNVVHYSEYQRTREDIERERAKTRQRVAKHRGNGVTSSTSNGVTPDARVQSPEHREITTPPTPPPSEGGNAESSPFERCAYCEGTGVFEDEACGCTRSPNRKPRLRGVA